MKYVYLVCFFFIVSSGYSQEARSRQLMEKMLNACDALKSATFVLKSTERELDGSLQESEMLIKMLTHPLSIYLYMISPHPGAECLWKSGQSSNRVLVNPNGFPYINLKLSPSNSLLRQDSHHLISEIGFDYIVSMTWYYISKMGDSFFNYLSITDTLMWDDRTCYELTFDYKPFRFFDYTIQPGETLTSVANRFHVSDYVLLNHNPDVSDYDATKPGQKIKVPDFYNRKVMFYVDSRSLLPLVQITYDEKGFLEKYELKSFVINPVIGPDEFESTYATYGF